MSSPLPPEWNSPTTTTTITITENHADTNEGEQYQQQHLRMVDDSSLSHAFDDRLDLTPTRPVPASVIDPTQCDSATRQAAALDGEVGLLDSLDMTMTNTMQQQQQREEMERWRNPSTTMIQPSYDPRTNIHEEEEEGGGIDPSNHLYQPYSKQFQPPSTILSSSPSLITIPSSSTFSSSSPSSSSSASNGPPSLFDPTYELRQRQLRQEQKMLEWELRTTMEAAEAKKKLIDRVASSSSTTTTTTTPLVSSLLSPSAQLKQQLQNESIQLHHQQTLTQLMREEPLPRINTHQTMIRSPPPSSIQPHLSITTAADTPESISSPPSISTHTSPMLRSDPNESSKRDLSRLMSPARRSALESTSPPITGHEAFTSSIPKLNITDSILDDSYVDDGIGASSSVVGSARSVSSNPSSSSTLRSNTNRKILKRSTLPLAASATIRKSLLNSNTNSNNNNSGISSSSKSKPSSLRVSLHHHSSSQPPRHLSSSLSSPTSPTHSPLKGDDELQALRQELRLTQARLEAMTQDKERLNRKFIAFQHQVAYEEMISPRAASAASTSGKKGFGSTNDLKFTPLSPTSSPNMLPPTTPSNTNTNTNNTINGRQHFDLLQSYSRLSSNIARVTHGLHENEVHQRSSMKLLQLSKEAFEKGEEDEDDNDDNGDGVGRQNGGLIREIERLRLEHEQLLSELRRYESEKKVVSKQMQQEGTMLRRNNTTSEEGMIRIEPPTDIEGGDADITNSNSSNVVVTSMGDLLRSLRSPEAIRSITSSSSNSDHLRSPASSRSLGVPRAHPSPSERLMSETSAELDRLRLEHEALLVAHEQLSVAAAGSNSSTGLLDIPQTPIATFIPESPYPSSSSSSLRKNHPVDADMIERAVSKALEEARLQTESERQSFLQQQHSLREESQRYESLIHYFEQQSMKDRKELEEWKRRFQEIQQQRESPKMQQQLTDSLPSLQRSQAHPSPAPAPPTSAAEVIAGFNRSRSGSIVHPPQPQQPQSHPVASLQAHSQASQAPQPPPPLNVPTMPLAISTDDPLSPAQVRLEPHFFQSSLHQHLFKSPSSSTLPDSSTASSLNRVDPPNSSSSPSSSYVNFEDRLYAELGIRSEQNTNEVEQQRQQQAMTTIDRYDTRDGEGQHVEEDDQTGYDDTSEADQIASIRERILEGQLNPQQQQPSQHQSVVELELDLPQSSDITIPPPPSSSPPSSSLGPVSSSISPSRPALDPSATTNTASSDGTFSLASFHAQRDSEQAQGLIEARTRELKRREEHMRVLESRQQQQQQGPSSSTVVNGAIDVDGVRHPRPDATEEYARLMYAHEERERQRKFEEATHLQFEKEQLQLERQRLKECERQLQEERKELKQQQQQQFDFDHPPSLDRPHRPLDTDHHALGMSEQRTLLQDAHDRHLSEQRISLEAERDHAISEQRQRFERVSGHIESSNERQRQRMEQVKEQERRIQEHQERQRWLQEQQSQQQHHHQHEQHHHQIPHDRMDSDHVSSYNHPPYDDLNPDERSLVAKQAALADLNHQIEELQRLKQHQHQHHQQQHDHPHHHQPQSHEARSMDPSTSHDLSYTQTMIRDSMDGPSSNTNMFQTPNPFHHRKAVVPPTAANDSFVANTSFNQTMDPHHTMRVPESMYQVDQQPHHPHSQESFETTTMMTSTHPNMPSPKLSSGPTPIGRVGGSSSSSRTRSSSVPRGVVASSPATIGRSHPAHLYSGHNSLDRSLDSMQGTMVKRMMDAAQDETNMNTNTTMSIQKKLSMTERKEREHIRKSKEEAALQRKKRERQLEYLLQQQAEENHAEVAVLPSRLGGVQSVSGKKKSSSRLPPGHAPPPSLYLQQETLKQRAGTKAGGARRASITRSTPAQVQPTHEPPAADDNASGSGPYYSSAALSPEVISAGAQMKSDQYRSSRRRSLSSSSVVRDGRSFEGSSHTDASITGQSVYDTLRSDHEYLVTSPSSARGQQAWEHHLRTGIDLKRFVQDGNGTTNDDATMMRVTTKNMNNKSPPSKQPPPQSTHATLTMPTYEPNKLFDDEPRFDETSPYNPKYANLITTGFDHVNLNGDTRRTSIGGGGGGSSSNLGSTPSRIRSSSLPRGTPLGGGSRIRNLSPVVDRTIAASSAAAAAVQLQQHGYHSTPSRTPAGSPNMHHQQATNFAPRSDCVSYKASPEVTPVVKGANASRFYHRPTNTHMQQR